MQAIRTLALISLVIFCYYLTYYFYLGITHPIPAPGDSWDYHIPIALSILDGSFLSHLHTTIPQYHYPGTTMVLHQIPQWYYPGSSEAINAIFLFLHLQTVANIFAIIILFFSCWKLGITFRLSKYYAILFALTFVTTNVILRWSNAVSIDVWIGVWFTLGLALFERPKKSITYFTQLGFVLGMLIGSKYTALFFLVTLLLIYGKKVLTLVNIKRLLAFLLPFSFFGLFWYIRNYIWMGNPFYPLSRLGFNGPLVFSDTIWIETIKHPLEMINAGFGEYKLWLFSVLVAVLVLIYQFLINKCFHFTNIHKLFLIGFLNFIFFFCFPTSAETWIMVSSFRYSFPAFIPLMLGVFLLAHKYNKEELIGYFSIANMISILSIAYYPKLIFFYFPIALTVIYFFTVGLPTKLRHYIMKKGKLLKETIH